MNSIYSIENRSLENQVVVIMEESENGLRDIGEVIACIAEIFGKKVHQPEIAACLEFKSSILVEKEGVEIKRKSTYIITIGYEDPKKSKFYIERLFNHALTNMLAESPSLKITR